MQGVRTELYLYILILCGIWSKGITASIVEEETRESSDNLVRQKRVINHIPGEDETVPINRVPYIVIIKQYVRFNCVGSILSHHVAITAAICVEIEVPQYFVISGSNRLGKGRIHNATDIKKRFHNHPNRSEDGIALLTVDPTFVYGQFCKPIELHSAPLLAGTIGTILGWGYNVGTPSKGTCNSRGLRGIVVPIMAHRDCVNIYRPRIEIMDVDVCTYHQLKHCGHTDGGAPLVVDGYLAGVHLWTGPDRVQNDPAYPDVFAVLQHSAYNQWIRSHI